MKVLLRTVHLEFWKSTAAWSVRRSGVIWHVGEWMGMEQWWNGTDRGKLKCWEKNIIQRGW